jgi:hypothetical protein
MTPDTFAGQSCFSLDAGAWAPASRIMSGLLALFKRQTPGHLKTQVGEAVGLLRALLTGNGGIHSTEGGSM